ncbi:translation initiation factor 2 [Alsobacter sp. SYSU M60028]|uniref:Translation initiation factor 2 n=1 Tax=Alsobacter ponti TaxID=2962936 RepID=A0ABT1LFE6_9HYPH|nr:translation initiation factor 2 [Alsobacter ponti]MCP8938973.1 translation initiation factor 2 [Alsobacter ponti]
MMRNMGLAAAMGLALALAGCATVTRGTTNQVTFTSEPSGAEVKTSIGHGCTTPCTIEVPRKSEFVATFSLEGYKPAQVPVATRVAGAGAAGFAGNVLVGGLVGMGVDAATGATYEHFPNPVSATLDAVQSTVRGKPKAKRGVPQA